MNDSSKTMLPLSSAQHGIWLGQQLDTDSPMYNTAECVEILGRIDTELFEQAVRHVLGEAEALHVHFVSENGVPKQVLRPPDDWQMQFIDLSDTVDPWQTAKAWMHNDLNNTVSFEQHDSLFNGALFKAGSERYFWYQRAHHIVMDGFAFSLIMGRVADVYTALDTGHPFNKKAFQPFSRLIAEDQSYLHSDAFARDQQFWTQRFIDRPIPTSLTDRFSFASNGFIRQTTHVPRIVLDELKEIGKEIGENWTDVMIAVIAVYFHRVKNLSELIFGMPVMGRLGSVSLKIPAMVMNIVPLRVPVRSEWSLIQLAKKVAEEYRLVRPHQRYRYEYIRRDLNLIGGNKRLFGPVINIMPFDFHFGFSGSRTIVHNISAGPVEDLSIGVYARSDNNDLRVDFDANPSSYTSDEVKQHQRGFTGLLMQIIRSGDQPIRTLKCFTERSSARHEVKPKPVENDAEAIFDAPQGMSKTNVLDGGPLSQNFSTVVQQIRSIAQQQPQKIAVEHKEQQLTYGEMISQADELAARLLSGGTKPDSRIAIMLPRGLDAVISILGVLFSGGAYLPLDPASPPNRIATILTDATPDVLITTSQFSNQIETLPSEQVLLLDETGPFEVVRPMADPEPSHLAYVIYTSGSTGQPNGVMIDHRALAAFVTGAVDVYQFHNEHRMLQFAPLHFDASVEEIFLTLCMGATLVLRSDEMMQSIPIFLETCLQYRISVLDLPTAFWHELTYALANEAVGFPETIHTVIIGGEAALPCRVSAWFNVVDDSVSLFNTYGPTEATVVTTSAKLSPHDASGNVPIGRPLPGVRAVVVDDRGQILPHDHEGELLILSHALARGYLGNSELNDSRFINLKQLDGSPRAYRTGDLVSSTKGGRLIYRGRADEELKISGNRVDPLEIESSLLKYPGVHDAAVVGRVSENGIKRLLAYVVAGLPHPSSSELRQHLLSSLPPAMVPSVFKFTDSLPKTSSGKIDRKHLKNEKIDDWTASTAIQGTETEKKILDVWQEVLGINDLTVHDDFFDLGGQSLQTIQVATRLAVKLNREIPVVKIFQHPTISELANYLDLHRVVNDKKTSNQLCPEMEADLAASLSWPKSFATLKRKKRIENVLLTGCTGFVGTHLLHQLLTETTARIHCLVRASDSLQASERIHQSLTKQALPSAGWEERLVPFPADLSLPRFGLASDEYDKLAKDCDLIVHNAAIVSVMRQYRSVRNVNVLGTRSVVELATTFQSIPIHYISTHAVAAPESTHPEFSEEYIPAHSGLNDGYQKSKWVAEDLLRQANERGLQVSIYRLGRVTGSPGTGFVNEQDLIWKILSLGIPKGILPDIHMEEYWTPVDWTAKAIIHLTKKKAGIFNIAAEAAVQINQVFSWVREYGYDIRLCLMEDWNAKVTKAMKGSDASNAVTAAFFAPDSPVGNFKPGRMRYEKVTQEFTVHNPCTPMNRELMFRYLETAVAKGILPEPNRFKMAQ